MTIYETMICGNTGVRKRKKTIGIIALCSLGILCIGLFGCSKADSKQSGNWVTDDSMIRLYQHETGEVVSITLEEYLCGVLAGEMDNSWPEEALESQAILARTFTLEKMEDGAMAEKNADASTDIK